MPFEFTAVYQPAAAGGYVAFVPELTGANTQGETLEEARANLREAAALVLEANRALAEADLAEAGGGAGVVREPLALSA